MNQAQLHERDPVAIQRELLALSQRLGELEPKIIERTQAYYQAKQDLDILKAQVQYIKGQMTALQSVLKSLGTF